MGDDTITKDHDQLSEMQNSRACVVVLSKKSFFTARYLRAARTSEKYNLTRTT